MQNDIVVEDVRKSYGKVQALKGVSLQAEAGKILGLLGPNGAGKTTLIRILTTLLKPDSGRATIAGIDVAKHPMRIRSLIGLAGQYPAVDEMLTGRENLVMVGQLYHFSRKASKERAQELLEQFSLTDAADRTVKTYSGGMRRRLDLAASIVARPAVLFLDEPTTGLDPRTRNDLWEFIRQLVDDGTTLLLTTQQLEEADNLADWITVIDHGEVIAAGTSETLKSQLGQDVLELQISNRSYIPQVQTLLESIGRETPHVDTATGRFSVVVPHGTQSLLEAVRVLDQQSIAIADIALRRPTLDEVFLSITSASEN
ncbi:MAG: ATP-binding cassette domain-containing protein [Chloroflexi bacterium]|nr:MAG: daunorubicin/doxorubicin resistance ABC transporter ATP-binding protein DrrA [Phototrophicales bacterium]RMF78907.1 MAG: ATP-binding cassette domain-containing protein [Chloroflexota bacterium]